MATNPVTKVSGVDVHLVIQDGCDCKTPARLVPIDDDTAATATLGCRFTLAVAVGVGVGAPRVPGGEKLPKSSAFQGAEILYDLFGS